MVTEWLPKYPIIYQGVKRLGHEAIHSLLYTAEVKNGY